MLNPIALEIFGLKIYWYGITYALGFLFAYFFIIHNSKHLKIPKEKLENILFYTMIFSIIGARLFEIIIYNPLYYLANPFETLAFWHGGMSIHGGILGGFLALYYQTKKHNLNLLKLTDIIVIPLSLFLAFGRLANFINQELIGTPTNSNLGIIFSKHDQLTRWPYQIFASIKNILLFQILYYMQEFKKPKTGIITAWFLILYSFPRFLLDFLREPTLTLGIISMGQLLSLIYGTIGIYLLLKLNSAN